MWQVIAPLSISEKVNIVAQSFVYSPDLLVKYIFKLASLSYWPTFLMFTVNIEISFTRDTVNKVASMNHAVKIKYSLSHFAEELYLFKDKFVLAMMLID